MATIHPSRMALISQAGGRPQGFSSRPRSPSPARRRRSPTPNRSRSRSRERGREGKDRERDRDRDRAYDADRRDRGRDRDERESRRDRDLDGPNDRRRASPQYDDYRRPAPSEPEGQAPWRQLENMYPNRNAGRDRPPHAGGSYGGGAGGSDFMESRRLQRENQTVNVWPRSPKAPARGSSPKRSKSSKKSKRARSPSTSDASSDEDRRRRERKEKKRSRKERGSERRRHRSRSRSRSRRKSYDDDSEDDRRRKRESRHSRSKSKDRSQRSASQPSESEEHEWVVKTPMAPPPVPVHSKAKAAEAAEHAPHKYDDDSDDEDVGPQPLFKASSSRRVDERSYGGALLRGEGSAMAAFLQDGTESRIPRRGEIGLTSDEIAKYEDVGYVMSGSRHRRMNAVRMRKENQVISAEEKRGILKLQKEERERRETILREEFNELVSERLKGVPEPKTT
ncbi:hypothetical protein D9615_002620 [Tricholomella constricta]|uniref:NF-kappa-B-activating protein C-terminal domain-containing protein n=1 Tax=Tricholomella constricta TaxID=117010 RepID=A0A8H5HM51_9AGAR|nr:hypothetical protein D9615_002620 [Tricholomella constricta]